jgi:hypothetical protein
MLCESSSKIERSGSYDNEVPYVDHSLKSRVRASLVDRKHKVVVAKDSLH